MKIKAILIFLLFSYMSFGQSPQKFTYQSIIKNSSGYLLKNQDVGLKISVLRNSSNGIEVYSEEHFPTSNSNGLVTLIIGEGLTNDNFSEIQWGDGEYFLKVEVDPEGGNSYIMNQTSQLLSVPYALYAGNSGSKLNLLGQDFITLQDQTLTINKVDLTDDVNGVLTIANGGTGSSTAPMVGVITAVDSPSARVVLGLGTAATNDSSAFATAAQGALADTALQSSNNLSDITNVVAARTALGIDVSGTDNSTNVSLAGSLDYLTLSNQEITLGQVDYDTDISNTPTLLQLGTTSSTALAGNTPTITSGQSSAITANTAKNTNVTTDLSISGTTGARTIESSDGTDAIIPIATTDVSGLLSPGLFDEIDANTAKTGITSGQSSAITANTAKNTNVTTDLSISGTTGARTIESSDGTDAIIPIATTDVSGLLSPGLFDEIDANTAKTGITSSQSSAITANTSKVTDSGTPALTSDGSDPSLNTGITAAEVRSLIGVDASNTDNSTNVSLAGSLDYLTLSNQEITLGQVDYDTDISNTPTLLQLGTTSSTALAGNTPTITSGQSSAITANTAKNTNVTTDLSISGTTGARTIESSDGTDAIIPIATTDVSGLLSPGLFDEIDANTAKTGITSSQSSAITANTSKVTDSGTPALTSDGSDPSLNTGITAAEVRSLIGVDASNTDNSTNVSLAGSLDYLTLSNQEITLGQVDYDTDISNTPTLLQLGTTSSTALAGNTPTITSGQSSAITANTAKNTNVTTDLSISGTTGARTIESSDGTDAIIPIATTDVSGLLSPGLFDEIDANTAKTGITSSQSSAITANTSKVTDSGTPALTSDGSDPSLNTGITAAEVRSLIGVDASNTDNSTNVSLANTNYLSISGQEITGGTIPISSGGTGATTASAARTALGVDVSGTDNSSDVTLATVTGNYLSLSNQEITAGNVPISLGGTGATTASAARTALGLSSLSIGGSSGGGTVDISSEQLRIVGTLNEIETSASSQTITIGLPSYVNVNLVGDVTGNVSGNLSGTQVSVNKILNPAQTISTTGGTITLNGMSGRFRISAFATSATINNDIIDSNSVLICTISSSNTNDYYISSAVSSGNSGSGSFTVTLDQIPAYDVDINFIIMN